jgi:hypothetical protein
VLVGDTKKTQFSETTHLTMRWGEPPTGAKDKFRSLAIRGIPWRFMFFVKRAIDPLKKELPAVLWSGTFTRRANGAQVQHISRSSVRIRLPAQFSLDATSK